MFKRKAAIVGLLVAVAGAIMPALATSSASAAISDFRVGIQLVDRGGRAELGPVGVTDFLVNGGGSSPFTGDANFFDPDAARLLLSSTGIPTNLDFRIGGQAVDGRGALGTTVFSGWASEGSSTTGLVTDDNQFDPDGYRVILQVRAMPPGVQINDVRLTIAAFDVGVAGPTQATPWQSQGGGFSPFAFDANFFDPDGFIFGIQVA